MHVEAFKEWFWAKRKKWITNGFSGKNDAFCHSALLFGRNLEFLQMIGVFGSQGNWMNFLKETNTPTLDWKMSLMGV